MKSKEEIEQLAEKRFPIEMVAIFTERDKVDKNKERRKIFIETYTQCQEDMADEIAQLKKSIQKAVDLMCEADEEIADLKEQLARLPKS